MTSAASRVPHGFRWRNPVHLLACGFGSGLMPQAPGTYGTALAIPLYLLLVPLPLTGYLAVLALLTLLGIWACDRAARDFGVHDHQSIVWDEVLGYLVTMALAPPGWLAIVAGFVLFRFFDIIKPWPIRQVDRRVEGGFGIVLDDLLAGVYAGLVLQLLRFI